MPRAAKKKPSRRTLELSARYSPRINRRFLKMLEGISTRSHMPESDVLRYCFEAELLSKGERRKGKVERRDSNVRTALDAMVTVRTTRWMEGKVEALWRANPDVIQADVLRGLLEHILPIARDKGMAHVMKIRESGLTRR